MASTLLRFRSLLLLLLLLEPLGLIGILPLGIPLAGLQNEDTDQNQRQYRVTGSKHSHAVLPTNDSLRYALWRQIGTQSDDPEALDDVCKVDNHAHGVERQGSAIKQEVGLGWLEQLGEEAEEADGNGDVQDSRDDGRRGVHEPEVSLQEIVVLGGCHVRRPEERIIEGEGRKEHA